MEYDNAAEDTSAGGSLLPLEDRCSICSCSFWLVQLYCILGTELLCVHVEWIRRQMQEVAVGNYRAFIVVANALLAIREEVSSINKHLESLILEKRKMNQTLLANHSTLFNLLEIPQLMDTYLCVRNGNFDEALDLEAFVVYISLWICLSFFQLPECLRIIGYLRRIGVFSEYEMRLQIIPMNCFGASFTILHTYSLNAYEYLKGMINCHRMHLFDVVNQYRAIFVDDTSRSEENYDGGLLFSWAMHHITSHLMIKGYSFQECFLALAQFFLKKYRGLRTNLTYNTEQKIFQKNNMCNVLNKYVCTCWIWLTTSVRVVGTKGKHISDVMMETTVIITGEMVLKICQWVYPEAMNQNPKEILSHNPYEKSIYNNNITHSTCEKCGKNYPGNAVKELQCVTSAVKRGIMPGDALPRPRMTTGKIRIKDRNSDPYKL
ncbi:hypothetical protein UlMin_031314 [Ulmus minor]